MIHRDSLHWYLAIIYEPEHILKDPPVVNHKSPPRPQTRQFTAQAVSQIDSSSSRIDQCLDSLERPMEDSDQHSEVEVEHNLDYFQASCTIGDQVPPQPNSHSDIYESSSRSADFVMASPNHRVLPMTPEDDSGTIQHHLAGPSAVDPPMPDKGRRSFSPVDPERFYQSSSTHRTYGKNKKLSTGTTLPGMDVDPDEIEIIDKVPEYKSRYI
jgi:hypothetical protein